MIFETSCAFLTVLSSQITLRLSPSSSCTNPFTKACPSSLTHTHFFPEKSVPSRVPFVLLCVLDWRCVLMKLGAKVAVDLEAGICGRGLCLLLGNKGMTGTTVITTASVIMTLLTCFHRMSRLSPDRPSGRCVTPGIKPLTRFIFVSKIVASTKDCSCDGYEKYNQLVMFAICISEEKKKDGNRQEIQD